LQELVDARAALSRTLSDTVSGLLAQPGAPVPAQEAAVALAACVGAGGRAQAGPGLGERAAASGDATLAPAGPLGGMRMGYLSNDGSDEDEDDAPFGGTVSEADLDDVSGGDDEGAGAGEEAAVSAGLLPPPPADEGGAGTAGTDGVGRAISDILGSIFGGFNGNDAPREGRKGWREEDGTQTKTDPDGARTTPSVALMDPPSRKPPPREPSDNGPPEDDGEVRNPVDYGDDAPDGDVRAFMQLGPGARIRTVAQKEEQVGPSSFILAP